MDIRGKIALVTGANRGLGRAFAEALLEAGAAKVYAGARDPSAIIDPRVTPIQVDVTSSRDIATAATICTDIESLINNAGAMLATPVLAENSEDVLRHQARRLSGHGRPPHPAQGARHYRDRGLRRPDRHRDGRDPVQRPEKPPHGRWPRKQSKAFALAPSMS
jgi:NAD(P)-dependent dehydrogenase (short-subunit alcohol dehydrogenase family)